jgi:class 3 adenylate cyclase
MNDVGKPCAGNPHARFERGPLAKRATGRDARETLGPACGTDGTPNNQRPTSQHTGDGFCAAFSSPRAAVDAAVDAQRSLGLPVRIGVGTGEAELRGDDYFGPALHRAARVMGAGHGGQILVAASTAALLDGVELVDLGEHRLRDLSGAQRLFQVRAEGLKAEFPPVRTLDAVPGNLRPQATSFVDRDTEIEQLVAAVRAHRMVKIDR